MAVDESRARKPDWRAEYPFASRSAPVGGFRYHYIDEGTGDPILMVHGNPTWSFYWRKLIAALRAEYRCVAVDHIGCGLSDKPWPYPYRLAQHVANLSQLIDALDLRRITLAGHDWGGAIGLGAAVEQPERFSRLILLNTAAFPPPFVPWRLRLGWVPLVGQLAIQGANLFARAATRMALHDPSRLSAAARSGLLAPYGRWSNRVGIYRFVRDIPFRPSDPTWQQLDQIERRLPCLAAKPVTLIWGMRDWCFTPECLERLSGHFPNAEVHRLDDVGHYVMEEAADTVIDRVTSFLARHSLIASREPEV